MLTPQRTGNAHTSMAAGHTLGALQPDGRRVVEPTFDPVHVAQTVAHIASLPNSVTILDINIMYAFIRLFYGLVLNLYPFFLPGRLGYLMQDVDETTVVCAEKMRERRAELCFV